MTIANSLLVNVVISKITKSFYGYFKVWSLNLKMNFAQKSILLHKGVSYLFEWIEQYFKNELWKKQSIHELLKGLWKPIPNTPSCRSCVVNTGRCTGDFDPLFECLPILFIRFVVVMSPVFVNVVSIFSPAKK